MTQKQTQQPKKGKDLHEFMTKYCGHDPLAMRTRGGSSLQQLIYRVESLEERLKAAEFIEQAWQPSAVNADPAGMVIRKESMPDLYSRIEKLENVTHNLAELISKMGSTSAGVTNGQQALNVMLQKEITQLNEKVEDLQEEVANLQSQLLP